MTITVPSGVFLKEGPRGLKDALGRFKGPTTKQEIDYFLFNSSYEAHITECVTVVVMAAL